MALRIEPKGVAILLAPVSPESDSESECESLQAAVSCPLLIMRTLLWSQLTFA